MSQQLVTMSGPHDSVAKCGRYDSGGDLADAASLT
jgi:hypothetical protein